MSLPPWSTMSVAPSSAASTPAPAEDEEDELVEEMEMPPPTLSRRQMQKRKALAPGTGTQRASKKVRTGPPRLPDLRNAAMNRAATSATASVARNRSRPSGEMRGVGATKVVKRPGLAGMSSRREDDEVEFVKTSNSPSKKIMNSHRNDVPFIDLSNDYDAPQPSTSNKSKGRITDVIVILSDDDDPPPPPPKSRVSTNKQGQEVIELDISDDSDDAPRASGSQVNGVNGSGRVMSPVRIDSSPEPEVVASPVASSSKGKERAPPLPRRSPSPEPARMASPSPSPVLPTGFSPEPEFEPEPVPAPEVDLQPEPSAEQQMSETEQHEDDDSQVPAQTQAQIEQDEHLALQLEFGSESEPELEPARAPESEREASSQKDSTPGAVQQIQDSSSQIPPQTQTQAQIEEDERLKPAPASSPHPPQTQAQIEEDERLARQLEFDFFDFDAASGEPEPDGAENPGYNEFTRRMDDEGSPLPEFGGGEDLGGEVAGTRGGGGGGGESGAESSGSTDGDGGAIPVAMEDDDQLPVRTNAKDSPPRSSRSPSAAGATPEPALPLFLPSPSHHTNAHAAEQEEGDADADDEDEDENAPTRAATPKTETQMQMQAEAETETSGIQRRLSSVIISPRKGTVSLDVDMDVDVPVTPPRAAGLNLSTPAPMLGLGSPSSANTLGPPRTVPASSTTPRTPQRAAARSPQANPGGTAGVLSLTPTAMSAPALPRGLPVPASSAPHAPQNVDAGSPRATAPFSPPPSLVGSNTALAPPRGGPVPASPTSRTPQLAAAGTQSRTTAPFSPPPAPANLFSPSRSNPSSSSAPTPAFSTPQQHNTNTDATVDALERVHRELDKGFERSFVRMRDADVRSPSVSSPTPISTTPARTSAAPATSTPASTPLPPPKNRGAPSSPEKPSTFTSTPKGRGVDMTTPMRPRPNLVQSTLERAADAFRPPLKMKKEDAIVISSDEDSGDDAGAGDAGVAAGTGTREERAEEEREENERMMDEARDVEGLVEGLRRGMGIRLSPGPVPGGRELDGEMAVDVEGAPDTFGSGNGMADDGAPEQDEEDESAAWLAKGTVPPSPSTLGPASPSNMTSNAGSASAPVHKVQKPLSSLASSTSSQKPRAMPLPKPLSSSSVAGVSGIQSQSQSQKTNVGSAMPLPERFSGPLPLPGSSSSASGSATVPMLSPTSPKSNNAFATPKRTNVPREEKEQEETPSTRYAKELAAALNSLATDNDDNGEDSGRRKDKGKERERASASASARPLPSRAAQSVDLGSQSPASGMPRRIDFSKLDTPVKKKKETAMSVVRNGVVERVSVGGRLPVPGMGGTPSGKGKEREVEAGGSVSAPVGSQREKEGPFAGASGEFVSGQGTEEVSPLPVLPVTEPPHSAISAPVGAVSGGDVDMDSGAGPSLPHLPALSAPVGGSISESDDSEFDVASLVKRRRRGPRKVVASSSSETDSDSVPLRRRVLRSSNTPSSSASASASSSRTSLVSSTKGREVSAKRKRGRPAKRGSSASSTMDSNGGRSTSPSLDREVSPSPPPRSPSPLMKTVLGGIKALSFPDSDEDEDAPDPSKHKLAKDLPMRQIDEINFVNKLSTVARYAESRVLTYQAMISENTAADDPLEPEIEFENRIDAQSTPPFEFYYTNEYWHDEGVPLPTKKGLYSCGCGPGGCKDNDKNCACFRRQAKFLRSLGLPETFMYDDDGRLRSLAESVEGVPDNIQFRVPIMECNDRCGCGEECRNRVIQKGRKVRVGLKKISQQNGWGVVALERIPSGTFVGIYSGELLTDESAEKRASVYTVKGRTYMYGLDFYFLDQDQEFFGILEGGKGPRDWNESRAGGSSRKGKGKEKEPPPGKKKQITVDAYHAGNFTRFLNHSCDPNCRSTAAYINDANLYKPLLVLFTIKDVKEGEEMTFSYHGHYPGDGERSDDEDNTKKEATKLNVKCNCGSKHCTREILF